MDDTPLYNSRIIDTYIKLIKRKYSYINIAELLACAGMKPYEVLDQGHWFTQSQVNLFHDRLRALTGNKDIAREAGRYSASPDAVGVMRQYILGLVGPANAFNLVKNVAHNFTRSSQYESRRLASNKIELNVIFHPGVKEQPFQCENRIGFFEALPMAYNIKSPHVDHPECVFKGGETCKYIITWERPKSTLWRMARNWAIAILTLFATVNIFYYPVFTLISLVPLSIALILFFSLFININEKSELKLSLDTLKNSTDNLIDQININYNNALVTNEIGQAISRQTNIDDILSSVIQVLEKRLDYTRGLILLVSEDRTRLEFRAGFGYREEQIAFLKKTTFHLDRPESKGVFIVSFREQKPFLVNDINDIEGNLSSRSLDFARKMGVKSFICCPIICDSEAIGILAVDNLRAERPLVQSDMSLLMGIAPVIGISIHNANLIDAKLRQFSSILQVMAKTIDARDPMTAGHSEKVTEYALGICDELGLSKEYCEMIRVAALLHDYGKVGVPDSILKKNGRLTDLEYEIVKTHAHKTRDILEQVHFEGVYKEVPEIAGAHHEKVDGTGYPKGLKGKETPLGAKIISVADFFEAITSKRHYRDPMPLDEAFRLLNEGSGSQFEKRIVDAFTSYYHRTFLGKTLQLVKSA